MLLVCAEQEESLRCFQSGRKERKEGKSDKRRAYNNKETTAREKMLRKVKEERAEQKAEKKKIGVKTV